MITNSGAIKIGNAQEATIRAVQIPGRVVRLEGIPEIGWNEALE